MSESTLIKKLQRISDELKAEGKTENVVVNALKQELQYYVLDFIYNHPKYAHLVMYGGSLLRIAYDLPRMSEDLDFQTDSHLDLEELKRDMTKHFRDRFSLEIGITTKSRPALETKLMTINFDILQNFQLKNIKWTTLKIRFDVNFFEKVKAFVKESMPIVHEGLTFSILTYPLSTLMASKILAVLRRTNRGIGNETASCKPRDIYDLIWYLERKSIPDMEYLKAKGESYETLYDLFYGADGMKGLKFRIMNLSDDLFEKDLAQFFFERNDFDHWLSNWRPKFETLMSRYKMFKIKSLDEIQFGIDFSTRIRTIHYVFSTDQENKMVQFTVRISERWFDDIKIGSEHRNHQIESKIESAKSLKEVDYEYIGLFYKKIKEFRARNKQVVLNDRLTTKLIRATGDQLNPRNEIYLDKRILEHIQFEELI